MPSLFVVFLVALSVLLVAVGFWLALHFARQRRIDRHIANLDSMLADQRYRMRNLDYARTPNAPFRFNGE